jgi:hypothetical protein
VGRKCREEGEGLGRLLYTVRNGSLDSRNEDQNTNRSKCSAQNHY